MVDQVIDKFDPTGLAALALALVTLVAVVVCALRARLEVRRSRRLYLAAIEEAGRAARATSEGNRAAEQSRRELLAATELMRELASGVTVLTDELNEQNDELRAARERAEDAEGEDKITALESETETPPVGQVGRFPAAFATWKSDGDEHYAQVNLWPTGGGVDLSLSVNGAAVAVCLDWQSLDILSALASELRPQDPSAPPVGEMVRAEVVYPFGEEPDGDANVDDGMDSEEDLEDPEDLEDTEDAGNAEGKEEAGNARDAIRRSQRFRRAETTQG